MSNIEAIKTFFEKDGGRKIAMDELKALTSQERYDLAVLCAEALSLKLDTKV